MLIVILLAFLIRIILMPISAHSDLFFINYYPNRLVESGQIAMTEKNVSYYPPLTFYTFAFFQYFYRYFSDTFSGWMDNLYQLSVSDFKGQAADYIREVPNPNLLRDIFLAKFPYLIFDLAAVIILLKFIQRKILSKFVVLIWLFNPVSIYVAYMMGQFDLIPAFFVLLGFLMLRKHINWAFFIIGIAAAYKNYAFLFILPTALIYGKTWQERLRLLVFSLLPYLIFLIPTLVTNAKETIFALIPKVYLHYRKPLEGWPLYSQIVKYIILATSYVITLIIAGTSRFKDKWHFCLGISLISILLVLAIAPRISFHYLLWSTPLIILWYKKVKIVALIVIIQAITLASYKLLANHLQAGLFAPLNPDYFSNLPTINSFIDQIIPYGIISSLGFFIFFFFNLYLAVKILSDLIFRSEIQVTSQPQKR